LAAIISAFLWNSIIIYAGYLLGNNIAAIDKMFKTYSAVIITISVLVLVFILYKIKLAHKK
jgi:membrane protein DedA with SNARE-associated domain